MKPFTLSVSLAIIAEKDANAICNKGTNQPFMQIRLRKIIESMSAIKLFQDDLHI
jgi:hypothetical protein